MKTSAKRGLEIWIGAAEFLNDSPKDILGFVRWSLGAISLHLLTEGQRAEWSGKVTTNCGNTWIHTNCSSKLFVARKGVR